MKRIVIYVFMALAMLLWGCRKDDVVFLPEVDEVAPPEIEYVTDLLGFYLLNEGNMGSNKSTLDWMDFSTGEYSRNIYGIANPDVPKELGDVGNDLAIYGSRLYAVINCSNKVEVMDARTCRRLGMVEIPNCRSIAFSGPYAYVTSYAGPVEINPDYRQRGYVARIDTATLRVDATCLVGYQPDRLAIAGDRIYVANSGGYRVPNYERTMSVIDIPSFSKMADVDIAINLDCCVADNHGHVWISSRGDYYDNPPKLVCYDIASDAVLKEFHVGVGSCWLDDDSLYIVGATWSNITMSNESTFVIIDTRRLDFASRNFIADGTEAAIKVPYGVAVNPLTKEIYVTDAGNYVNPGWLMCYGSDGVMKWRVRAGDIPAHFAFFRN